MEAEGQHFTVAGLQREHDLCQLGCIFAAFKLLERRWTILRNLEGALILAALAHLVE